MQKQQKRQSSIERRRRRQKIFNRTIIVAMIIIIVVLTAVALSRPQPTPLPSYLSRCIPLKGPWAYREVFQLFIQINGANVTVPGGIGITSGGACVRPLYTFSNRGAIHVEPDQNRTFTLGDLFIVWGNTYGNQFGTFNQNQLFTYKTDSTHHLLMRVYHGNYNFTSTDYDNYVLPRDANTTSNPYAITISYGVFQY